MWETAWQEAALARAFVERLGQVPAELMRPAVPPVLDRDPYLSAWTNVQAALGNAPEADRERVGALANELDQQLSASRCARSWPKLRDERSALSWPGAGS
jgi:hypothetical protein